MKPRYKFIPAVRDHIARKVPFPEADALDAIAAWEAGYEPKTPLEHGVFAMCDHVRSNVEAMDPETKP